MKSIWISRTYRDEIREPKQGLRWPLYGRENHTSEQLYSRKTWRIEIAAVCICEAESPRPLYNNPIAISLCSDIRAACPRSLAIDTMFGQEGVAG